MYERTFSGALGPYFSQIKEIAAGGNGRVLSGIDTRFDFPVCIKRISVANKDECRAALREIRIRRRLRHENIVGLLNAIVSDGTDISDITPANFRETSCIFLVQELLDADLRQVIESHTRLSDEYVKLFFYQLLRGLKYIHSANVLHRDLKPSNVMININSLQLMIGDFGHSMVLDPEYSHGSSVKVSDTSLWYKAPELILGTAQYSTASDIWAVGCVLAEMLLGRPLFEGENDLEQLELIIHAIKVPPKDQTYIRTFLTDEVNTMYSGEPKFPLQSKFLKVDCQALHLLEHLLSFNPEDRVTAEVALSHPFLHEFACVADEPVCLKQLHLEHEVDDFLEYTLKDLIVGECVALAEEQPRIHLQMSSCSSLNDLTKECHISPSESASQSLEERRSSLELTTVSEDYHEQASNDSEGNRFKVLEVLKEEHGSSSSDTNGLATHEEGVSEEPLVLDHPMFSSSKWERERERHKSGHRRHHHHRRKKKFHLKSPSSEIEPSLDCNNGARLHEHTSDFNCRLPEIHVSGDNIPGNCLPRLNSPEEERCLSPKVEVHSPEVPLVTETTAQDDKVHELIMKSRQLIADQATVMNEVPAITDICCTLTSNSALTDVCGSAASKSPMTTTCGSLSTKTGICSTESSNSGRTDVCEYVSSKENPVVPMEIGEAKVEKNFTSSLGDLSVLSHHRSTVDLGVAEVIRRSQELLGEVYRPGTSEEKTLVSDESDRVQDLIARSEQLLKSNEVRVMESKNTAEYFPCVPEEKSSVANEIDRVQDLITASEQLLKSNEITELTINQCEQSEEKSSVNDLISKSEQLRKFNTEHLQHVNKQGIVKHCGPEFALEDKAYPPTFTDKSLDFTTQLPPANHLLANNSNIHSSVKDLAPRETSLNHLQPVKETVQPIPSDRRMQELLEESHTLVNSLKTDQNLGAEAESALKFEEKCGKIACEEQCEEFSLKSTNKKENFDKGLDGIDLNELKLVLDQAKKLLEKSNELKADIDMDVDENAEGNEESKENYTIMEVDQNGQNIECGNVKNTSTKSENTIKDVLKDFSCYKNQIDFATAVSEQLATNEQAAMFEVKLIPPLEQETTQFNCLTARSKGSTIPSDCKSSNLGGFGKCAVEKNNHFHTGIEYKQVLVKKRSNDTLSETNDDNTHKHFKNCRVTSPDVNLSTAVCDLVVDTLHKGMNTEQSRKHCSEYDSRIPRLNGFNTDPLDLNVDKRLIAASNYKTDLAVSKNQVGENDFKPVKNSPKYESATRQHRNGYSNTDEVVDKLCGSTCRMESNTTRLNSKDSARLQSFYATLKIKSIMRNRTRSHREKRHDTYPF